MEEFDNRRTLWRFEFSWCAAILWCDLLTIRCVPTAKWHSDSSPEDETALQKCTWSCQILGVAHKVEGVNFPGLKSSQYYASAQKYLPNGYSGVLSFLGQGWSRCAAARTINALKLVNIEVNVAEIRSCAFHFATSTNRQMTDEENYSRPALNQAWFAWVLVLKPLKIYYKFCLLHLNLLECILLSRPVLFSVVCAHSSNHNA